MLQLFYCARYSELAKADLVHELDFSDSTYQFEAVNYQVRSQLILGELQDAKAKIEDNRDFLKGFATEQEQEFLSSELDALLHYAQFLKDNSEQPFFDGELPGGISSLLAGCYYAKKGDYDTALTKLQPDGDLENVAFGCYLLLLLQRAKDADNYLSSHVGNVAVTDTIGYNQTSSWIDLGKYGEDLKRAYYNYDELCSSANTESLKCLVCLLVAHIKLLQFPEAQEVLQKVASLESKDKFTSWDADLLINQIALASLDANKDKAAKLEAELRKIAPKSAYIKDLDEKNVLFDGIVAKYN